MQALVVLPYGGGPEPDFDAIYADYLKPGLEAAGLVVMRAANAQVAPATRSDTFQKLLLADLVVVDLALPEPGLWYELGLRRALLARGVLLAGANSLYSLPYHLKDGRPDAELLPADRTALASLALENAASWRGRPDSASDAANERRRVFLFSGHMIDSADRAEPRFPADREQVAAAAIAARLDALEMGGQDLAICGGACGGDLLFAEAALHRKCALHLYLQFAEAEFLRASVAFAGESWVSRYYRVKEHPLTRIHLQPEELGPLAPGMNPYVRNNVWQLCAALLRGTETIRFIALWNGEDGGGPGGTRHMVETVRRYAGKVSLIDTRQLFGLLARQGERI